MNLTAAQLDFLHSNGFTVLRQLAEPEEVSKIRVILMDLYGRHVGFKSGRQFDVLDPTAETYTLGQLTNPRDFAPELNKTLYLTRAKALARQILGPNAVHSAEFVLMKPAKYGAATPWHQDAAYRSPSQHFEELTFWMPLQDVDEASGCMQFVPGTHIGTVLPHRSPNANTKSHSLECSEIPSADTVVSIPMHAGDCSIHSSRVLHGSPANRSDVPRFAYILVFQTPETSTGVRRAYPWNLEKTNINGQRYKDWFWHGGFVAVLWRKLRRGDFSNVANIKVSMHRALLLSIRKSSKRKSDS
jgi:hypothetical protein